MANLKCLFIYFYIISMSKIIKNLKIDVKTAFGILKTAKIQKRRKNNVVIFLCHKDIF